MNNKFKKILDAIKNKEINYGEDYYFVLSEDGDLVFLKKNLDNPHQKDLDKCGEIRNQWPENEYDGEVIWKTYVSRKGCDIVCDFLDHLEIKFLYS